MWANHPLPLQPEHTTGCGVGTSPGRSVAGEMGRQIRQVVEMPDFRPGVDTALNSLYATGSVLRPRLACQHNERRPGASHVGGNDVCRLFSSHAHVRTALPKPGPCRRSHESVRTGQSVARTLNYPNAVRVHLDFGAAPILSWARPRVPARGSPRPCRRNANRDTDSPMSPRRHSS